MTVQKSISDHELAAVVAAQRAIALAAHAADARDGQTVSRLFTPDCVFEGSTGIRNGRDEVRRHFEELPLADPPLRHHISSIYARFDDEGILRATSYFLAVSKDRRVAGVYDDEFQAVGVGWLIKHRAVRIELRD
jgi:hypothetical protein